ncbi:Gfo/Idh/MocA family oxidoreductase [Salmonella enterica]|nr:Gfo/Idh/MocA family oxidoreductase [Salmonella enterica]EHW1217425.1 Gfo/Idh/MocA family oxidoreductase [Salmonella enterica]EIA2553765.1 Gfo/Idh/MocA family oxidoreductase [Salmonella enterica]EID4479906.1 Gfo/Idh/MocA family oxidoreductase [Salmonella enterica]
MKILIIGFGYAGHRYMHAFTHLSKKKSISLEIAYVSNQPCKVDIPYFENVPFALNNFKPDIAVVSVNDQNHMSILKELMDFKGFIICEKPLATPEENWFPICDNLRKRSGFALDLVERYSDATRRLKKTVSSNHWSLIRSSFHWGKDRLNDYRPTCGATSEIIHALDLISWICPCNQKIELKEAIGICSDFSISGEKVLDTILLTASLGKATIAAYSSFVNIKRQRTVDFSFLDLKGQIIHSQIIYDTPNWDNDYLCIWKRDNTGNVVIIDEFNAIHQEPGLETVYKLSQLCEDVVRYVSGEPPHQDFATLEDSINLQKLLDSINDKISSPLITQYIIGSERTLIPKTANLESLG